MLLDRSRPFSINGEDSRIMEYRPLKLKGFRLKAISGKNLEKIVTGNPNNSVKDPKVLIVYMKRERVRNASDEIMPRLFLSR